MTSKQKYYRRLAILEAIIRPKNSISYKLRQLTDRDRKLYEAWKHEMDRWLMARPGEQAYIDLLAILSGDSTLQAPPELSYRVFRQLYPVNPKLPKSDLINAPQKAYEHLIESLK